MASESIPTDASGATRGAAGTSAADPAFPPPVHDHSACTCRMMARAEDICRRDGLLLSPQRRRVLEALLSSHAPIGAYDLIERLAEKGPRLGGEKISFPYFISALDPANKILNKEMMTANFTFGDEAKTAKNEEPLRVLIPLAKDEDAANHRVLVGFQLTEEQIKAIAAKEAKK